MLILNMVQGSFMATIAEGLTLAQATGQSQQTFLDILCQGQMASTFVDQKCQSKSFDDWLTALMSVLILLFVNSPLWVLKQISETRKRIFPQHSWSLADILQGNFKPDYYLKHIQKDLRLAISMGDMANHPTPMAAAANEVGVVFFKYSCFCAHAGSIIGTYTFTLSQPPAMFIVQISVYNVLSGCWK